MRNPIVMLLTLMLALPGAGVLAQESQAGDMSDNPDLMSDIARDIAQAPDLEGIDWSEVSVVVGSGGGGSSTIYGYAYDADGDYTAFAPRFRDVAASVEAYREWLRLEGDEGFTFMLFQFNRDSLRVNARFSYETDNPWRITPDTLDEMILKFRPNLG